LWGGGLTRAVYSRLIEGMKNDALATAFAGYWEYRHDKFTVTLHYGAAIQEHQTTKGS